MSTETTPQIIFKVMALGDAGVGKTSLLLSYVNNRGWSSSKPSTGADFVSKNLSVNGKEVALQMWDTAGQERYRSLTEGFFRDTQALVLVFDLSNPVSFHNLDRWYEEFIHHGALKQGQRFPIVVVGNKSDAPAVVKDETVRGWCNSRGNIPYFYTSAKEGVNVQEPFDCIAKDCLAVHSFEDLQGNPAVVSLEDPDDMRCNPFFCRCCNT